MQCASVKKMAGRHFCNWTKTVVGDRIEDRGNNLDSEISTLDNTAVYNNNDTNNNLLAAIGLLPGGSSFVHVHNYGKGVKNLKTEELHEKHAVATWSLGNHLSIRL